MNIKPQIIYNNPDKIAQVEVYCKGQNIRLTNNRKAILDLLLNKKRPIKAYDVIAELKYSHLNTDPPTIYRALDFLCEHGFVYKIEKHNSFIALQSGNYNNICKIFVCGNCYGVEESNENKFTSIFSDIMKKRKFHPRNNILEIHGFCKNCYD